MEDYAKIRVDDIRHLVGGRRRLKLLNSVTVHLADRDVPVELARGKANLGVDGKIIFLLCPACGRHALVLRVVPEGLACWACLRRGGVKYGSQLAVG
jgi:hypothetical protein